MKIGYFGRAIIIVGAIYAGIAQADDIPVQTNTPSITIPANDISSFVSGFPTNIPGAKKVEKEECFNPKYVFVHIRQNHMNSLEKGSLEQAQTVKKAQDCVYEILDFLQNKYGNIRVYSEAVTQNHLDSWKAEVALKDVIVAEASKNPTNSSLNDLVQQFEKEVVHVYAVNRLLYEHKIDLRAGEDEKLNQDGLNAVKDYFKKENDFKKGGFTNTPSNNGMLDTNNLYWSFVNMKSRVYGLREQYLIDKITKESSGNPSTNFIVFGGDHDFKSKIKNWNFTHPDKFSLITITPESYVGRGDLFKARKNKQKIE